MKTAKEIALTVQDPASTWEGRKKSKTPVGKAQQIVLDALGVQANNFFHADAIFRALGIGVVPKRVGRTSIPSVGIIDTSGGEFDEVWDNYAAVDVDLSAIKEWMD